MEYTSTPVATRPSADIWSPGALHYHVALSSDRASWTGHYSVGSLVPIMAAQEDPIGFGIHPDMVGTLQTLAYRDDRTMIESALEDVIRERYRPALEDVIDSLFVDASCVEEGWREFALGYVGSSLDAAEVLDTWTAIEAAEAYLRAEFGDSYDGRMKEAMDR